MKKVNLLAFITGALLTVNSAFAQEAKNLEALDSLFNSETLDEVVVTSGVIDIAKVRETPIAVSTIFSI